MQQYVLLKNVHGAKRRSPDVARDSLCPDANQELRF